jgi:L-amino acid N-acyltransferase YncA
MAILLEETLTLYQRTTKERGLKINIGSKVNTNAITEANFKLQKDLMAWVLQKNQFQITLHNSTIAHYK